MEWAQTITTIIAIAGIVGVFHKQLSGRLDKLGQRLDKLHDDHVGLARELSELKGFLEGRIGDREVGTE